MSARLLGVALAALLFVGAAEACSWVVIQPDEYKGAPGFWAVWHAIWHRNAWVVVAAYDNAKACAQAAEREFREGMLPLEEVHGKAPYRVDALAVVEDEEHDAPDAVLAIRVGGEGRHSAHQRTRALTVQHRG